MYFNQGFIAIRNKTYQIFYMRQNNLMELPDWLMEVQNGQFNEREWSVTLSPLIYVF